MNAHDWNEAEAKWVLTPKGKVHFFSPSTDALHAEIRASLGWSDSECGWYDGAIYRGKVLVYRFTEKLLLLDEDAAYKRGLDFSQGAAMVVAREWHAQGRELPAALDVLTRR